ncbi:sensor histidine kinase [Paenibacillus sp. GSMTC-2017]|uniref:sensor histidine kinase n=1 Tax=Paenibacillus sp. GSMTC-2017 TaxID=2794350 RepID=UPI0018D96C43|nr:sensor histidine kinase [Paenibacillus sp. GSMTC-2017]MBH5319918.1 sensor histidine kinase [Paenibacillus sp. GSMTC-2017]
MIKKYIIERRSWILLFIFIQLLVLFVSFVDSAIPLASMLYVFFLSIIVFVVFLVIRYDKETKFYKSLEEHADNLDVSRMSMPDRPFEQMIETYITEQVQLLKQTSSQNRMILEQEKDDLLSWIHEVKTPLTAMRLMIDRLDNETIKANLTFEWLRIHLLLDQQLHQRRIPYIENDLFIEQTDLEAVIFSEIKTLQSWCIQKGLGFDIQLESTAVISDAKWVAFIIRQLLTNAVKYSESSDITITSYEQDGGINLKVQDCGRGIDARDLPRIFDKGFTSTTMHRDTAATGMGLYLAKKAAESLSINIHVESALGVGTAVTLVFPQKNEFVRITSV